MVVLRNTIFEAIFSHPHLCLGWGWGGLLALPAGLLGLRGLGLLGGLGCLLHSLGLCGLLGAFGGHVAWMLGRGHRQCNGTGNPISQHSTCAASGLSGIATLRWGEWGRVSEKK